MTIDESKEVLKRAINTVYYEIREIENIFQKSNNKILSQRKEQEYNKLNDLKNLLKEYLEKYSYVFTYNTNLDNIDDKINFLNQMTDISKKILNFKFRWFFYNINIYNIFENFKPEFSNFIAELDNQVLFKKKELQNLKTKNKETNLKFEKFKEYKPMNINYGKIEEKKQEIINQANSKQFYSHDLYNGDNNLYKIEDMKKLYSAAATAIMNLSITSRTQLDPKERQNINWIIGAYEKAYRIFFKKFESSEYSELDYKNAYSTTKMIDYSNKLIQHYMLDNKNIYQEEICNYNEMRVSDILSQNIWRMSFSEIKLLYKDLVREFEMESYKAFDQYTLQNNFICAVFQILKFKKLIKKDEILTNKIKREICSQILEDELLIKEIEKSK